MDIIEIINRYENEKNYYKRKDLFKLLKIKLAEVDNNLENKIKKMNSFEDDLYNERK
jgi:hypothetical protein